MPCGDGDLGPDAGRIADVSASGSCQLHAARQASALDDAGFRLQLVEIFLAELVGLLVALLPSLWNTIWATLSSDTSRASRCR